MPEEASTPSKKDKMDQKEKHVKKSKREQKKALTIRKKFKTFTNLFKRKKELKAGNGETSCSGENSAYMGEEIVNVGNTICEESHPEMKIHSGREDTAVVEEKCGVNEHETSRETENSCNTYTSERSDDRGEQAVYKILFPEIQSEEGIKAEIFENSDDDASLRERKEEEERFLKNVFAENKSNMAWTQDEHSRNVFRLKSEIEENTRKKKGKSFFKKIFKFRKNVSQK